MNIPLPLFVLRRVVRANPWLLEDGDVVPEPVSVRLGIIRIMTNSRMRLLPHRKARLQAEAAAGTLFSPAELEQRMRGRTKHLREKHVDAMRQNAEAQDLLEQIETVAHASPDSFLARLALKIARRTHSGTAIYEEAARKAARTTYR